jgi:PKD repeat protein
LEVTDSFGNKGSDWLDLTVLDTIKPVPIITGSSTFAENESVMLSARSSKDNGLIVEYVWTFNDNGPKTYQGPDLFYFMERRGHHDVSLTIYDEAGNFDTAHMTINLVDIKDPIANAGPDRTVSIGSNVILDGSRCKDDGTMTKYQWTFTYDGEQRELMGMTANYTFDLAGSYQVTLKVYDDNDNSGNDTLIINVKDTGTVKGILLDENGKPVKGALVEIVASDGKIYSVRSVQNGSFSLEIPAGPFTWKISKNGYETISGSSSVAILEETIFYPSDIQMKKVEKSGPGPILLIIPAVIVLLIVIGIVVFLMMRKRKDASPEDDTAPVPIQPIPTEGSEETAQTPPIPDNSDPLQEPPAIEEPIKLHIDEKKVNIDDLFTDKD